MKKLLSLPFATFSLLSFAQTGDAGMKAYNNFDFVAGDKIIFEDHFTEAQDGEFPPKWNLINGQGVVNAMGEERAYVCVEGTPGSHNRIAPVMKTEAYLGNDFTLEFDVMLPNDQDNFAIFLYENEEADNHFIEISSDGKIGTAYFGLEKDLSGQYPGVDAGTFPNKWRHISLAFKNQQIKVYADQYRVVVIPKCGFSPRSIAFGLTTDTRLKNIRLAEGGDMNMLGKIMTDGKLITHNITFDVNKATIKPQSMGEITLIANLLKENASLKLEIDGHTDSDGDDASNLTLSQQRADAVKAQLVAMGIDASRLTTKGLGESKPLSDNTTPEGKAQNRRVEFIKM